MTSTKRTSKPSSTSAALPERPFRELPLADRRRLTRLARGLTVLLSNATNLQRLGLVDVAPRAAGRPLVTLSDRGRRCILAAEASGYDTGLTAGQLEDLKEIHKPLCPRRANPQGTCTCGPLAPTRGEALATRAAVGPGVQAAAAAGVAFAWTGSSGVTRMVPRGIGRDEIRATILTPGGWSIIGSARDDARASREVQAAVIAVETLRRSIAARAGRGADAPKLDVVERARALFEPGQVPLGGTVGDLVLDMIGEIERLRGTSTPPADGGIRIRFTDLLPADQVKLIDFAQAGEQGLYAKADRLIMLRLIEHRSSPSGLLYFITPTGQRVLDDWRAAGVTAQATFADELQAEAERHTKALAAITATFKETDAQQRRRR